MNHQNLYVSAHTGEDPRPGDGEAVRVEADPHHVVHIILQERPPAENSNGTHIDMDHSETEAPRSGMHWTNHVAIVLIDGHIGSGVIRSSTCASMDQIRDAT